MPPTAGPVLDESVNLAASASDRGVLGGPAVPFVLTRRPPSPEASGRIERHWTTAWDLTGGPEHAQPVLPHPCVNVVAYDGLVRVHGIPAGVDVRRLRGRGMAIGTKLRPGAFASLTAIPMAELRDAAVTLEEAFGPDGRRLEAEILGLGRDPEAVGARLEAFLLARAPDRDPRFDLVLTVARDLLGCPPETRIPDVARRHGVSHRTLQRAFRDGIGASPKWVLARYRLHEATERLATEEDLDLAGLAHELGYADQAHLSRDLRATVGVPPAAYARACRGLDAPRPSSRRDAA